MIGSNLSLLLPPIDFDAKGMDAAALCDNPDFNLDGLNQLAGYTKDGNSIRVMMSISRVEAGEEARYSIILHDYTHQFNVERLLRDQAHQISSSKEQLSAIMNSVTDGVIGFDRNGHIHLCNAAGSSIFGYSVYEVDKIKFSDLLPYSERPNHEKGLLDFLSKGISDTISKRRETTGLRADGSEFPLEITISWREVGSEIMFVAVCRDISAKKRAEEEKEALEAELRQAQKMESLGILSGGIAHEINTPVQYVGDNIRFLQEGFDDLKILCGQLRKMTGAMRAESVLTELSDETDRLTEQVDMDFLMEEVPEAIEQSLEGVNRISEIVRAIKEFAHPDAKDKVDVDINAAIQTTIMVSRNQWKYVARLTTDFDQNMPLVPCLPGEFNQVILNLIVNAAHAIEAANGPNGERGTIHISTSTNEQCAKIVVSDSGTGIKPEITERIFDPFFTTKEPGKGTGQGLSISHNIITNKHGGSITVDSEIGKGSSFCICLPLDRASGEDAAEMGQEAAAQ